MALWVRHFRLLRLMHMDRPLDKKSKKSKPRRWRITVGVPANAVVGPLGYLEELNTPEGEQDFSHRELKVDRSDSSTVASGEGETRASRIALHDKRSEARGPTEEETSATGAVVDGNDHGNGRAGERS